MARTYGKAQDLIDYTRASSGTALRRVKYGAELIDTANDASAWSAYGSNTVVQDGDAVKATYVDSASGAYIYLIPSQGTSQQLAIGTLYTLTANAKVNTGSVSVEVYDGSSPNQMAVSSTSYIDVQINFIANGLNPYIRLANMGSGEIIWIKNISVKEVTFDTSDGDLILFNHPNNIPRIEYDANGNVLGLLVEEQRVNLYDHSEAIIDVDILNGETADGEEYLGIVSNKVIVIAPDLNTSTGQGFRLNGQPTTTGLHTFSLIVKGGNGINNIRIRRNNITVDTIQIGTFNLSTGVATNEDGVLNSKSLSNGWYYIWWTDNVNSSASLTGFDIKPDITETADGVNYFEIMAVQMEAGSFPTSYIPTSGSTATRSADVASLSTSAFGYRQDEGTVVVDVRAINDSGYPYIFSLDDGSSDNRVFSVFSNSNTNSYVRITSGGVTQGSLYRSIDGNAGFKLAVTYSPDEMVVSESGETVTQTSISSLPVGISALNIASSHFSTVQITGHIKSLKYYPRALTADQIEALTA